MSRTISDHWQARSEGSAHGAPRGVNGLRRRSLGLPPHRLGDAGASGPGARRRERADALARIDLEWPKGGGERQDQLRRAAIEELMSEDPKKRRRSWPGWWL